MHPLLIDAPLVATLLLVSSLALAQEWEDAPEPQPSAAEPTAEAAPPPAEVVEQAPQADTKADSKPTVVVVDPAPPAPERQRKAGRVHDGFYFRVSPGIGSLATRFDNGLLLHERISGSGASFDLLFGGTPARGFVLGGGLLTNGFNSRDVRTVDVPADRDSGVQVGVLGPFVDIFPNPRRGLHVGGMLGLAGMAALTPGIDPEDGAGTGAALALWLGHDWWVSREWSLGVSARYLGVAVENEDGWSAAADTFSLAFTVLYH